MGALIPTGADQEICAALSQRFSDNPDNIADPTGHTTYIQVVREHNAKEQLFDRAHQLHRVAWRLKGYPKDQKSMARWYFLLRKLLPHETKHAIKSVLGQVVADTTIARAEFYVQYDSSITLDFELHPSNSGRPDIHTISGKKVCYLTLVCKDDEALPDPRGEVVPPTPDINEAAPPQLP